MIKRRVAVIKKKTSSDPSYLLLDQWYWLFISGNKNGFSISREAIFLFTLVIYLVLEAISAKQRSAASNVASISFGPWAKEVKPASNAEGAR